MSWLDANHDGYITRGDFSQMAAYSGSGYYGQMQAQNAFSNLDWNHDGMLDRYELHRGGMDGGFGYHHHHHYGYY